MAPRSPHASAAVLRGKFESVRTSATQTGSPPAHALPGRPSSRDERAARGSRSRTHRPSMSSAYHMSVSRSSFSCSSTVQKAATFQPNGAATVFEHAVQPFVQRGRLRELLLDRVAQLELVLGALARGDVEHHALQHRRAPCWSWTTVAWSLNHSVRPVLGDHAVLGVEWLSGAPCCAPRRPGPAARSSGMQPLVPRIGTRDPLLHRVAEDRLDLRAHVRPAPVGSVLGRVHDRGHALEQGAVAALGLLELVLRTLVRAPRSDRPGRPAAHT